jgi:hypothetical protein
MLKREDNDGYKRYRPFSLAPDRKAMRRCRCPPTTGTSLTIESAAS